MITSVFETIMAINLILWSQYQIKKQERIFFVLLLSVTLSVFLLLILSKCYLVSDINQLILHNQKLEIELKSIATQKKILQKKAQAREIVRKDMIFVKDMRNENTSFLNVLLILGELCPAQIFVTSLSYNSDQIIIDGKGKFLNHLFNNFLQDLITQTQCQVKLNYIKMASELMMSFQFVIQLKKRA
jgi:Tfp pilus assembly protein PilN